MMLYTTELEANFEENVFWWDSSYSIAVHYVLSVIEALHKVSTYRFVKIENDQ